MLHLWASLWGTGVNPHPVQWSQHNLKHCNFTSGGAWKRGWKKKKQDTYVGESSQHCSDTEIRFGPSRYRKIKAALLSTERLHLAESKNDFSLCSDIHSDMHQVLAVTARGCSPYRYPLLRFHFRFFYFHLDMDFCLLPPFGQHILLLCSSEKGCIPYGCHVI